MWITRVALFLVALVSLSDGFSRNIAGTHGLPEPKTSGGPSLTTVLAARRSMREYGPRELTAVEVAQLLWAAQGINDGHRTAPSAGGLYPLTVRVADRRGVWRYTPEDHALVHESSTDVREDLGIAAHRQRHVRIAPTIFVLTANVTVTANKYGRRAERFVVLEAGHVAQNVLLQGTALDLAAVPIGAFDDEAVRRALQLPAETTPLYLIPIGALP